MHRLLILMVVTACARTAPSPVAAAVPVVEAAPSDPDAVPEPAPVAAPQAATAVEVVTVQVPGCLNSGGFFAAEAITATGTDTEPEEVP